MVETMSDSDMPLERPEDELPAPSGETPAAEAAQPDDGRHWYVIHCYSGYENKVRHNL